MNTQALRQKILDLAIRGKLVPQDPNDEPASVLLERIRQQKQQMVKEGKLKPKEIKNDTVIFVGEDNLHYEKFTDGSVKCIEDEIPFEVPEGWAWTRLTAITTKIGAGSTPTGGASNYTTTGVKFIRSQNVYNEGLKLDNVAYITEETNLSKSTSIVMPQDILLNITGGSIGRCTVVPDDFDTANVNQHVMIIRTVEKNMQHYLHAVIISNYIQDQIFTRQVGSGRGGLSAETLSTFLFPVPPFEEQRKIVEKISNFTETAITIGNLLSETEAITQLAKAKILDLAIRGKLVPQDSNDEPASVLLERIRAEKEELIMQGKIKRDKKESVIFRGEDNSYYEKIGDSIYCIDDEIPFDIPNTWTWVRLQECCVKEIRRGKAPKYAEKSNTLVFAQKCNTKFNGIDTSLALYLDEKTLLKYGQEEYLQDGDTVINSTGTGTLGRVGYFNNANLPIVPDTHVTTIRSSGYLYPFYVHLFLKNQQPLLEESGEGSTNQKELRPATLKEMLVAIPPSMEQKRIIQTVQTLFGTLSQIDNILN